MFGRRGLRALLVPLLAVSMLVTEGPASASVDPSQPTGFLRVVTDPPLPSWLLIDGARTATWGMWMTVNVGVHSVCFGPVIGYVTPPCRNVTVTAGATATTTGSFVSSPTLRVLTSPAVASAISVDGVVRNNWGAWFTSSAGSHTVCFGPVEGFRPPPCQTVNVSATGTTTVTGSFTADASAPGATGVGLLRVTTSPPSPVMLAVNDQPRDQWGLNWMEFPAGPVRVCAVPDGDFFAMFPDDCVVAEVVAGQTTSLVVATHRYGSIRVLTQPATPSTVSIDGVDIDDWGAWTYAVPRNHTVCFGKVPGLARPACKDVLVTEGGQVTATGTFGPAVTNVAAFAGNGVRGNGGDGGPAVAAQLTAPWGTARGTDGSIFVADPSAGVIRKVSPGGDITTVAGCACPFADGVAATASGLYYPAGVAVNAAGDLYIAESGIGLVRRVDHLTGIISTVAGNRAVVTNPVPENVPATSTPLGTPMGVAFDGSGNLYILDAGMYRIRKVDTGGRITTFAGTGSPVGVSIGDGGPAVQAPITQPHAIAIRGGTLFFTDAALGRVRAVSLATGLISTVAGSGAGQDAFTLDPHDGEQATSVNLSFVSGLAVDAAGNLYLGDVGRVRVRRVDAVTRVITTVFDGLDLVPPATLGFSCGPGCLIRTGMEIAISGSDLIVTFAGDHVARRIVGVVPAGG